MIDLDYDKLRALGLGPALAQALACCEAPTDATEQWMRLIAVHRETLAVHDGQQQRVARCLPRLTRELLAHDTALAVGDWVRCQADEHGQLWLTARLPPLTHIVRRDADGTRHAVVSNIDTALLVMGLDLDFNLPRLERYLALVGSSGVLPVVVLTKADIANQADPEALPMRLLALRQRIGSAADVLALDARDPAAVQALRPYLGLGQTLVLLGSSGAGKSTLINTLAACHVQDTGAVRAHDSRGKHTTTARCLHQLPTGACVIDTPGMRTLRPDVDDQTLGQLFGDVAALSGACRFRDCRHGQEPGCAVRAQVSPERLHNYQKLLRESRRDSMTALERQRQLAQWKARGRAGHQRAAMKRGDG